MISDWISDHWSNDVVLWAMRTRFDAIIFLLLTDSLLVHVKYGDVTLVTAELYRRISTMSKFHDVQRTSYSFSDIFNLCVFFFHYCNKWSAYVFSLTNGNNTNNHLAKFTTETVGFSQYDSNQDI